MIPPEQNAEFVCQMETVLEVYQREYHPDFPVVCLDEAMKQLVQEFVEPVAMRPGQPKREDYKYERNGTANLFMLCEPMMGWRQVEGTQRRTAIDYAHLLKDLVDLYYPDVDVITVVQDNGTRTRYFFITEKNLRHNPSQPEVLPGIDPKPLTLTIGKLKNDIITPMSSAPIPICHSFTFILANNPSFPSNDWGVEIGNYLHN